MRNWSAGLHMALAVVFVQALSACNASHTTSTGDWVYMNSTGSSETFDYTGAEQAFTVPYNVTHVRVAAYGATGAGSGTTHAALGGPGGSIVATIPVTPGEILHVFVGGSGAHGGFNGGGSGGAYPAGGASDVREGGDKVRDRVVVAGGGGSEGGEVCIYKSRRPVCSDGGRGGAGGGFDGQPGRNGKTHKNESGKGGGGGNQYSGGAGGAGGIAEKKLSQCNGASGAGGQSFWGGSGGFGCDQQKPAGGVGGGGYFGGGGGGGGALEYYCTSYRYRCGGYRSGGAGGGGGGSSYAEAKATYVTTTTGGAPLGDGQIVISW